MKLNKIQKVKYFKEEVIKAKIINTEGSVPRESGTYMLVSKEDIFGTIGGGHLEFLVINKSKELLKNKIKKLEILNIPLGPGIGQCCGGYVQIELSYHLNGEKSLENENVTNRENSNLFIFGAGHIGQALSSKSINLNFNVHLIDSRKNFLLMNEYKDIDYIFAKEPWSLIRSLSPNSYYVILTHNHNYDFKIINEILFYNSFKFIGLIGSKTKKNRFTNRLKSNGHNQSLIDLIECPVGLDINHTKEPNEIAISIIAKLIYYRNNLIIKNLNVKSNANG
jgi:xanthine dehydrogenase accessory factor